MPGTNHKNLIEEIVDQQTHEGNHKKLLKLVLEKAFQNNHPTRSKEETTTVAEIVFPYVMSRNNAVFNQLSSNPKGLKKSKALDETSQLLDRVIHEPVAFISGEDKCNQFKHIIAVSAAALSVLASIAMFPGLLFFQLFVSNISNEVLIPLTISLGLALGGFIALAVTMSPDGLILRRNTEEDKSIVKKQLGRAKKPTTEGNVGPRSHLLTTQQRKVAAGNIELGLLKPGKRPN